MTGGYPIDEAYEHRIKVLEAKLNQIAVERDLARKERDSVSHRLDEATKLLHAWMDKYDDKTELWPCMTTLDFLAGVVETPKRKYAETFSSGDRQWHKCAEPSCGMAVKLPADFCSKHSPE